jgi:hypothetical protein
MKIVRKEEFADQQGPYPHLRDEGRAMALVNRLSFSQCRKLFMEIRDKSEQEALTLVSAHGV